MHPNPAFRKTPDATNIAFARERGFGILSINGENHPLSAHIPFLLSEDGTSLEAHLAPKPIWLTGKVDAQALARMLRMIVPVRMQIGGIDATWKLAQNEGDAGRMAAAEGLRTSALGHDPLAELMANPPA